MRKLIATALGAALITSFCPQAVTAQNINVQVSKTYNSKDFTKATNASLFAGELTEAIVSDGQITTHQKMVAQLGYTANINRARYSMKLEKRDKEENVIKENKLEGGESVFGPIAAQIINVKGKVFLVYTKHTGDNSKDSESSYQMFTAEVDQQTLELKDPKVLFPLEKLNIGFGGLVTFADNVKYEIKASPDSSKWLVFFGSSVNHLMHMAVLNQNFNQLWSRNEKIEDSKSIVAKDICVDNNGSTFIYYDKYIKSDKPEKHLAAFNANKKKDYLISSPNTEIVKLSIVPSKFEHSVFAVITAGGIYKNVSSIIINKLNTDDFKLSNYQTIPFDEALIKQFKDANWGSTKSKEYGIEGLNIKAFEMLDSSLAIIGQASTSWYDSKGAYTEGCGGYIIMRNNKGKTVISTIPRNTAYNNRPAIMHYTPYVYKNKILLFYNDLPENLDVVDWNKIRSNNIYQKYILAMASIDENGNIEKKIVFDDRKDGSLPIGKSLDLIEPNKLQTKSYEITGFGNIGNEYKIVTVTIN